MRNVLIIMILWLAILLPTCIFASVEEEIIVLFRSDVIQIPAKKETALSNEIIAPQDVVDCLRSIEVVEISKALPNFNPADTFKITEDGWEARLPNFSHLYVLRVLAGVDRNSAIIKLENLSGVIYAETNRRVIPFYVHPNDYWFDAYQWNLNDPTGNIGIDVMRAWNLSKGSSNVRIGIIDTGILTVHEDLIGREFSGDGPAGIWDSDHGTHVCGIATAMTNNSIGIAGIDWYAKIDNQEYGVSLTDVYNAVIEAVNAGCHVINCSWGYVNPFSQTLYNAFTYAYQHNVLPVAAMPYDDPPYCENPSSFGPWMLNVAGTDKENDPASYTWARQYVDVAAPGGDVGYHNGLYSTAFNHNMHTYESKYGTSMAAPHVTGIAGLLLGADPSLKNYDLEWIIKLAAVDISPSGIDDSTGYGLVKAYPAVRHVVLPYEVSRGDVQFYEYNDISRTFTNAILPYGEPAGFYQCDQLVADIWLNFSPWYIETPWAWLSLTGFSPDDPNDGAYWMRQDVDNQAAHLSTCFYYLKSRWNPFPPFGWIPVNKWVPCDPYMIPMQYTVIGRRSINAPTNLNAAAMSNSDNIKLTWTDNSYNELKFIIERRNEGGAFGTYDSVGQNVCQYIDYGTISGQTYGYMVYAKAQNFCTGYSNADYATAGLGAPSNLAVIDQPTQNSVTLEWQDNSSIEAGFKIARKVDDGEWNEDYKAVGVDIIQETDTVSFLHTYSYKIRAYDNQGHYSDWSNEIEFISGMLAQSDYPKMSAFNSNRKVARGPDGKIHVIYHDGEDIHYTFSINNGNQFETPWENVYDSDTIPALALDGDGVPWVISASHYWPNQNTVALEYYLHKLTDQGWRKSHDEVYQIDISSTYPIVPALLHPPSFVIVGDSGYIAFQNLNDGVSVSSFPLGLYTEYTETQIAPLGYYPSIDFDNKYAKHPRLVVVTHHPGLGPVYIYYRKVGLSTWNNMTLSDFYVYGSPSLCTGTNEFRIAFEGWDDNSETEGIFSLHFIWDDKVGLYSLEETKRISSNFDFDQINLIEGYSYVPSLNIVMWKYNDDIYYSHKRFTRWSRPKNISISADVSSYPQGVAFSTQGIFGKKLFSIWTEKDGDDYYLVRKIVNLNQLHPWIKNIMEDETQVTKPFCLEKLYPNPSKGTLRIRFHSPDERKVTVKLYDVTGRLIKKVFDGKAKVGINEIPYSSRNLSSGIYFIRLETHGKRMTEKVIFQR